MKSILWCLMLVFITAIMGCKNNNSNPGKTATTDTSAFYPAGDFFKSQVQYATILNRPIYKITTRNGKKDSTRLSNDAFAAMAGSFIEKDISAPGIKEKYKESVFHDMDTRSYTLNYMAIDAQANGVQQLDVLLDEGGNAVKRIFIRCQYTRGDTGITEQYSWKAFKSFQLNRHFKTADGYTSTELNYVNWGN